MRWSRAAKPATLPDRQGCMARLPSRMLVSALVRRVEGEGGNATIIHHGDDDAGVILIQCRLRGHPGAVLERIPDLRRGHRMAPIASLAGGNDLEIAEYMEKRRRSDPDMWLVELDIADAERFAEEILSAS